MKNVKINNKILHTQSRANWINNKLIIKDKNILIYNSNYDVKKVV